MKTTIVRLHLLVPETDTRFTVDFPARRPIEDCMEAIKPMMDKCSIITDVEIVTKEEK